jgi:hypothetical protein
MSKTLLTDPSPKTSKSKVTFCLFVIWCILAPGTAYIVGRYIYEQTILTWQYGLQMVFFSFMHNQTTLLFITLISLGLMGLWLILAMAWACWTWYRRTVNKRFLGLIVVTLLFLCMVFIPYSMWQRIMLRLGGTRSKVFASEVLVVAAVSGDLKTVKFLLERGIGVDTQDYSGTALIGAAVQGQDEVISFLLEKGAGINVKNSSGNTALINAASMNHPNTVQLLLRHGADATIRNDYGETAFDVAQKNKYFEVLKVLDVNSVNP